MYSCFCSYGKTVTVEFELTGAGFCGKWGYLIQRTILLSMRYVFLLMCVWVVLLSFIFSCAEIWIVVSCCCYSYSCSFWDSYVSLCRMCLWYVFPCDYVILSHHKEIIRCNKIHWRDTVLVIIVFVILQILNNDAIYFLQKLLDLSISYIQVLAFHCRS